MTPARTAFSLVELSIVLVILGLLVGGILAGQSLIRASELRAVSTEYGRYQTAVNAFRDKYFGLPGDITNAEAIWTQNAAAAADCMNNISTTTATCNGDGDGNIEIASTRSREVFAFWKQLANSGLVEGNYTGTYNGYTWGAVPGINMPRSKIAEAGWAPVARSDVAAQGGWYNNMFPPRGSTNWLEYGGMISVTDNSYLMKPVLKAEEAWNIDTKSDDGLPGQGKITVFNPTLAYHADCASGTATTATYLLNRTTLACTLLMGL